MPMCAYAHYVSGFNVRLRWLRSLSHTNRVSGWQCWSISCLVHTFGAGTKISQMDFHVIEIGDGLIFLLVPT